MSVSETILQDIAALKQSNADLRRQVDEGNRYTQQAIATMSGKLEGMSDLLQTVARLAERQDAHGSGLDRAFTSIKQVETHVDDIADENQRWRDSHVRDNAVVEKKLSTWHGIAIGISVAASVIVGVLAWSGNKILTGFDEDIREERTTNKRDDERLDRLERIEARYHDGSS